MRNNALISTKSLSVKTPDGRQILDSLDMQIAFEKVAIIGRNGAGKTTLLKTLTARQPNSAITRTHDYYCVHQSNADNLFNEQNINLASLFSEFDEKSVYAEFSKCGLVIKSCAMQDETLSQGQIRKLNLIYAKLKSPQLLILDEPSIDLDEQGLIWLKEWLSEWSGGLLIVSHDPRLQSAFTHFFILAESGCRYFQGSHEALNTSLQEEQHNQQEKYLSNIQRLIEQEQRAQKLAKRRTQKKNQGRLRELGRMTPKVRLNTKRSYAQESQGRVSKINKAKMTSMINMVKVARNQLKVALPLSAVVPDLPNKPTENGITLRQLRFSSLFNNISMTINRNSVAITGANGCGKTTLLEIIMGLKAPDHGEVTTQESRIAYISQGVKNWALDDSLYDYLFIHSKLSTIEEIIQYIVSYKFPLGLDQKPLSSLSPGERIRAAIMCIFAGKKNESKYPDILILDEPTVSLDSLAYHSLIELLTAWQGGLLVVSHDNHFLQRINMQDTLALGNT